eukprot:31117-Pelagococcus_subviridis.AAC.17
MNPASTFSSGRFPLRRLRALRERLHCVLYRREVEDVAEGEHGDGSPARAEAVSADGGARLRVHARAGDCTLVTQRLREVFHGHLPLLAKVFVPEPPRVRLRELVGRPRRVLVNQRSVHEGVDVRSKFALRPLELVLRRERVLAFAREPQADAAPARVGLDVADLFVDLHEQRVELLHGFLDVVQNHARALVFDVAAVDHAVDLVHETRTSVGRLRQRFRRVDSAFDPDAQGVKREADVHDGEDRAHRSRILNRDENILRISSTFATNNASASLERVCEARAPTNSTRRRLPRVRSPRAREVDVRREAPGRVEDDGVPAQLMKSNSRAGPKPGIEISRGATRVSFGAVTERVATARSYLSGFEALHRDRVHAADAILLSPAAPAIRPHPRGEHLRPQLVANDGQELLRLLQRERESVAVH